MLYREHGIVLRTYKLGEADRIVVLLTEGRGKVRAVAKGIRKTSSRFGARLEPTSHVALQLYEGRQLDTVTQVETVDSFGVLRGDLTRLTKAVALLEAVDQVAQEKEPNAGLYQLLLGGLRRLAAADSPLLVAGFFWKLLSLEGVRPMVDECVTCGGHDDLVAFDLGEGGVLCQAHRRGAAVSPDALTLLQAILGGRLGEALAAPPSPATHELDALATQALEHHIERRLRVGPLLQ
jgi:DNA repair protein RecO (recombination protein O)